MSSHDRTNPRVAVPLLMLVAALAGCGDGKLLPVVRDSKSRAPSGCRDCAFPNAPIIVPASGVAFPRPAVFFADEPVATWGRPWFLLSLGGEVSL